MTENQLNQLAEEVKKELHETADVSKFSNDELYDRIEEIILRRSHQKPMSIQDRVDASRKTFQSIRGYGLLDDLLPDESITEIMINGPDNIFIERNGNVSRIDRQYEDELSLENTVRRFVGDAGQEISRGNPIVDTRLPNGSRVNVVFPPVSLIGPVVTIRKFSKAPMTVERLIELGSITPDIVDILKILVDAKYNIFVSGGTGTGKTTFLNALSNFIPKDERIITIEDSAELQLKNVDNLVSLEAQKANSAGAGEVTIRNLIKTSLRMRPDRIIVGEVRGEEALDMLQAMNTGHDGSLSTGHANSTAGMLSRLETMVLQGSEMPLLAVRQQIASALDIIIHLGRMSDHSRRVIEITEVCDLSKDGQIGLNCLYRFKRDNNSTRENVSGRLVRTDSPMKNTQKLESRGYDIII